MCDVMVALPDATANGKTIFAKNSDRPAGECQPLHFSPGGQRGASIRCSYLEVPDTDPALATFGCRPYWCWGYETGLNEAGVAGGNAAVFTRARRTATGDEPGLTGMDLLRLGLERGRTAEQAAEVIITLLEKYGQWGSAVAGKDHEAGGYDNSFLLADRHEAWVLETAGRQWAAQRITSGVRTISNELTIRQRPTRASSGLEDLARRQEWHTGAEPLDFALAFSDHEHYPRQVAHLRRMRSQDMLMHSEGEITRETMMGILRDHYEGTFLDGPQFHQFLPDFLTLCMHDSPAGFTWGNTATSVVAEIDPESQEPPPFWLCYLPPCCGIYMALTLGKPVPEALTAAGSAGLDVCNPSSAVKDSFRKTSLWWRFQRIHDAVSAKPAQRYPELREVFDPVERKNLTAMSPMEEQVADVLEAIERIEIRWDLNKSIG